LEKATGFRRRFLVTDSLFSMDGDVAPLAELVRLADKFDALLIADEAHATGVFGEHGTGLLEELSAESTLIDRPGLNAKDTSPVSHSEDTRRQPRDQIVARVIPIGTLSKAVGVQGGFVTGSRTLTDWLWNSARTQMFSTALAVPLCAAAICGVDLIEAEPKRRIWLQEASARVRQVLREQGWNVPANVVGPIIPVIIGDAEQTMKLSERLERHGVLVPGIRPPTVPKGTSRLRISLSYAHGDEGISELLDVLTRIR
jgi:8-amino-7-oxononanoate synthase